MPSGSTQMKSVMTTAATNATLLSVPTFILIVFSSVSSVSPVPVSSPWVITRRDSGWGCSVSTLTGDFAICVSGFPVLLCAIGFMSTESSPYREGVSIPASQGSNSRCPSMLVRRMPISSSSHCPLLCRVCIISATSSSMRLTASG